MNYEFGKYSEMSIRGIIDILSGNFPEVTEENHREYVPSTLTSEYPVP